jgi:hypothetical protein
MATVAASSRQEHYGIDAFQDALRSVYSERHYDHVEFVECDVPDNDPNESDYTVSYEAAFLPRDLERAQLEVWITDTCRVGILFERRFRLAERLNSRVWGSARACAAGQEPASVTPRALISFVRAVAQGKVILELRAFPILGMGRAKALIERAAFEDIVIDGAGAWDWLSVGPVEQNRAFGRRLVRFQPW